MAAFDSVAPELLDELNDYDNLQIALRGGASAADVAAAQRAARRRFGSELEGVHPTVDERALRSLRFSELLPAALARAILTER